VKKGIVNDSVIVFVIAFFMPVIYLTLNRRRDRLTNKMKM
jgi:hypothetical protein